MSLPKIYLKEGFFKFLVSLEELVEKKEKIIFMTSIGIEEDSFQEFSDYLKNFNIEVFADENFIYPLKDKKQVHLDLNMSEWFALQASVAVEKEFYSYSYKLVKNKIEEAQKAQQVYNLQRIENQTSRESKTIDSLENLLKRIDFFTIKKTTAKITFESLKSCDVLPLRLVYLDGELCIVAENVPDKTLTYFAVIDIKNIEEIKSDYTPHISQIEVNEFVSHIRLINGNEERLILKIYSPGDMDLLPRYHYLGNPFVTSNPEGDMIWAASLEMCDDVYQWLYEMKSHVEILDPGHIRKEFSHYCELRKNSHESKKAS